MFHSHGGQGLAWVPYVCLSFHLCGSSVFLVFLFFLALPMTRSQFHKDVQVAEDPLSVHL